MTSCESRDFSRMTTSYECVYEFHSRLSIDALCVICNSYSGHSVFSKSLDKTRDVKSLTKFQMWRSRYCIQRCNTSVWTSASSISSWFVVHSQRPLVGNMLFYWTHILLVSCFSTQRKREGKCASSCALLTSKGSFSRERVSSQKETSSGNFQSVPLNQVFFRKNLHFPWNTTSAVPFIVFVGTTNRKELFLSLETDIWF